MSEGLRIAYFANPLSIHNCKWINHFAETNEVIVIAGQKETGPYPFLSKQVRVLNVLPRYSVFDILTTFRAILALREIIKKERINVIHSMYAVPNAIWVSHLRAKNHLCTTRGSDVLVDYRKTYAQPENLLQRISYPVMRVRLRKALRSTRTITCTSLDQLRIVQSIVGQSHRLQLVRTGIDTHYFKPVNRDAVPGRFRLFSPRSMRPLYNIDLLVKTMVALRASSRNSFHLTIIDDQPGSVYSQEVRALIDSENMGNNIEILNALGQSQMRDQFYQCDLVVMIPGSDGTPNSALEAMLCKRKVVIGPLNYDEDLFNHSTIWKAESWSIPDLCKVITEAAMADDHKVDRAYEKVRKLASLEQALSAITKEYSEIV